MSNSIDYTAILSGSDYEKKATNLMKRGRNWSHDFNQFVTAGIMYFHGEGNHNPEVLNGLVTIAYETRGVNAGHLIDYIAKTIPHKVVKDKENKKRFIFVGKLADAEYSLIESEIFLLENPVWSEWDGGASKAPKAFSIEGVEDAIARIMGQADKAGVVVPWDAVLEHAAQKAAAKKENAAKKASNQAVQMG